jgi:hypothetical protein
VIALIVGVIPLSFGLIAFSELAWTYHALATLTRQGAQYAATHCFEDDAGTNVVGWMQANAPAFPDRQQIVGDANKIQVKYWTLDRESHQAIAFSCGGGCSPDCVPDSVTVSITGYEFNHFLSIFGVPPLVVPPFSTTLAMESAGVNPETGVSSP